MIEFLKRNSEYVILNVLLLIYLFFVLKDFPIPLSKETLLFASDAQEYMETGQSFFDDSVQGSLVTRPFLFPLLLLLITSIGGYKLWFIFQLFLWVSSVNLLFNSMKKLRIPLILNCLGILLFCLNFSIIALIYHGLNEVIIIFLVSSLIWLVASNYRCFFSLKVLQKLLFLLVVLTLVKPLFLLPMIAILVLIILKYVRLYFRSPKQLLVLLLIISPILVQMSLVKVTEGKFTFSEISTKTYNRYIFTQLYQKNHTCDRPKALEVIEGMSSDEISTISKKHKQELFALFQENLKLNLSGRPVFLELNRTKENKFFVSLMKEHIQLFSNLFYFGFAWVVLFFIHLVFNKRFIELSGILFIGVLMYYIYVSSGISGLQGDRLVIVALPLAIVFYLYVINYYVVEIKNVIQKIGAVKRS